MFENVINQEAIDRLTEAEAEIVLRILEKAGY
jgi:hypothetical protein